MAVTENGPKTVSKDRTDNHSDDDYALERKSWNYGYIGQDNQGRHHHVDRKAGHIVVTENNYDRVAGAVPTFRVQGPILHAEALEVDDSLVDWITFIDDEVCGWNTCPVSAADQLQDVLTEGM